MLPFYGLAEPVSSQTEGNRGDAHSRNLRESKNVP